MQNISCVKWGVSIWDSRKMTELLVKQSDVVLITGTTLVNATFDHIMNCILKYNKNHLVYGVTTGGICKLMDLNRICPYGRNQLLKKSSGACLQSNKFLSLIFRCYNNDSRWITCKNKYRSISSHQKYYPVPFMLMRNTRSPRRPPYQTRRNALTHHRFD